MGRSLAIVALLTAAAFAVMVVLVGDAPRGPAVLVLVPLGLVGLARVARRSQGGPVEVSWSGASSTAGPAIPAVVVAAADRPPASRRQIVGAIARRESRLWLSSAWFAAGVAFCLLLTVLFGWVWANPDDTIERGWSMWFALLAVMAHPMVGMVVIGAHHAVTRGRRDGTEELFGSCPVDEPTRTAGHLWAGWVPAAAVAVFLTTMTLMVAVRAPRLYGPVGGRALADALAAVLLPACGSALGVALGRWAPWRLVPIAAVVLLVPVIIGLGGVGDRRWSEVRMLSTFPRFPDHDLLFTDPRVGWHLAWLAGLGALMGWLALLHQRRGRPMALAGALLALGLVAVGVIQARPLGPDRAGRLASLVTDPQSHQVCRSSPGVSVCGFRGDEEYLDQVLDQVGPVADAVPGTPEEVTLRQGFDGDIEDLGTEVVAELAGRGAPEPGALPLGFITRDDAMAVARVSVALDAVGLDPRPPADAVPTVIAGQARGVVALWLAGRGLEPDAALELADDGWVPDDHIDEGPPTAFDRGMAWPDVCSGGVAPPVVWSAQDLAAARALLAGPDDHVATVIDEHWPTLADPATTTDELLALAGLAPVGPPDRIEPEPVMCEY